MLFDTSYTEKRIIRKINQAAGEPFGFVERWKMGGIGSRRMTIDDISEEYKKYLNADHYISNANIELRPKGILIHFRHKLQAYTWVMTYDSLKMETNNKLKLTSDGKFIRFKDALAVNEKFILKLEQHHKSYSS